MLRNIGSVIISANICWYISDYRNIGKNLYWYITRLVGLTVSSHHDNSTPSVSCTRSSLGCTGQCPRRTCWSAAAKVLSRFVAVAVSSADTGNVDTSISCIMLVFSALSLAVDVAGNRDKQSAHWFWLPGLYSILYEYALKISAHRCILAAANVGTPWL